MNHNPAARASGTQRTWIARTWIALCAGIAALAACGGGVGTGGTGTFASGPITGFGSIIVNDVHYDERAARIEDDGGSLRDRAELRLGTVVDVESDAVRNNEAVASRVRIVSERIGRVDAVTAAVLTVNGLPVRVDGNTVFDERFAGGLAGVAVGDVVEVYGFATATAGEVLATRIEPHANATAFKFRGEVSALDTQARTFRIGTQTFVYPPQLSGRNELANGAFLRVMVNTARDLLGRWIVTSIGNAQPLPEEGQEIKANGLITLFLSIARFQIGPWIVDASAASIEDGPLALGLRVKVEGHLRDGVLVAREVRVLGDDDDEDDEDEQEQARR